MKKHWLKYLLIICSVLAVLSLAWGAYVLTASKPKPLNGIYSSQIVTPPANNPTAQTQVTPQVSQEDAKQKELEDLYQKSFDSFHAKRYSEAIRLADQILQQDDKFYKAYNIKGITQCYSKKFNEGMKNIDRALELNPDYEYARFNKALAYELYGQYDKALTWYDKALAAGEDVWSYYGIASIYGRRGDVPNTIKYLQKAAAMDNVVKQLAKDEPDFNPVKNSKEFQALVNSK